MTITLASGHSVKGRTAAMGLTLPGTGSNVLTYLNRFVT